MRFVWRIAVMTVFGGLPACVMPHAAAQRNAVDERDSAGNRGARAGSASGATTSPRPGHEGAALTLPAYEVRESAFSDFGMSVRTNYQVQWGGSLEWMEVIAVEPGSSAAQQNLSWGDRIIAIDGQPVTELQRDSMLATLFERKAGDRVDVLVLRAAQALPRFVTLTARRPPLGN